MAGNPAYHAVLHPMILPEGNNTSLSTCGNSTCAPMSPPVGVLAKSNEGMLRLRCRNGNVPLSATSRRNPDINPRMISVGSPTATNTNTFAGRSPRVFSAKGGGGAGGDSGTRVVVTSGRLVAVRL